MPPIPKLISFHFVPVQLLWDIYPNLVYVQLGFQIVLI